MPSADPGLVRCCCRVRALGLGHVRRVESPARVICHLGQTEVENLGGSARGHKDICRLDVAVDDALGMRGIERLGDVNADREQLLHLQRTIADEMLQRLAFQILHDDVGLIAFFADVINGADVGMIQGRRGLGLTPEAAERCGVASDIFRKEFQGDETMQARVFGLVNHAHPATTELLDHSVVRDVLADHFAHEMAARQRPSQNSGEPS